jgi:hypothetical protein
MRDVLVYGLIFWAGIITGYVARGWIAHRFMNYSGTIVVDTDDLTDKTVYSLVLDDYPEKLEFKKEVVFKIDKHRQSSNRE